ncbi:HD domain-containing protein [Candidatus Gracilibacteria bacterium]|nr:HD domain-containing protein [Candidatus Gracilibacteria bacterium]
MIGHFLNLIFKGTSIYRWNNFSRIENISTIDNKGFTLQVAYILSKVIEEKEGIKLDILYIFKKIIFSSFETLILSDINSDLQRRIINKNSGIYAKLVKKVQDFLTSQDISGNIKDDILYIYKNENNPKYAREHEIMEFSKLWVAYYEAYFSAKIYPEMYEDVLNNIKDRLDNTKYSTLLKYLNINNTSNDLEKFLLNIRRLQSNFRWNRMKRIYPISVMAHSYITFFLAYIAGKTEDYNDEKILDIMTRALFHDVPESITGDIVSPTKKAVPGFAELLGDIELEMLEEYLFIHISGFDFKKDLAKIMLEPFSGEDGKIVKMCDIFSSLFESKLEVQNSEEFSKIYIDTKRKLRAYNTKSSNYILNYGVDYFEDNMEEIVKL